MVAGKEGDELFYGNQYIGWDCLKRWAWTVCRFKSGFSENKLGGGGGGGGW